MKHFSYMKAGICLAFAGIFCPQNATARDLVFTASIQSGAVVTEISDIGIDFPGFAHIGADAETCEVTFGNKKLSAYTDYELMLTDGGGMFVFAFYSPLKAESPTQLTLTLPSGCVAGMWENRTDYVSNDSPIVLTYTVVPENVEDVTLSLTSVTTPDDSGELPLEIDGISRQYDRFYLTTDVPGILAADTEDHNVTLTGADGTYQATAVLRQAYGTAVGSSYFYFELPEAPTEVGDYTLTIAARAVTDAIGLRNSELGATNAEQEIRFKIVAEGTGIDEVGGGDDTRQTDEAVYTLDGARIPTDMRHGSVTIDSKGRKQLHM